MAHFNLHADFNCHKVEAVPAGATPTSSPKQLATYPSHLQHKIHFVA